MGNNREIPTRRFCSKYPHSCNLKTVYQNSLPWRSYDQGNLKYINNIEFQVWLFQPQLCRGPRFDEFVYAEHGNGSPIDAMIRMNPTITHSKALQKIACNFFELVVVIQMVMPCFSHKLNYIKHIHCSNYGEKSNKYSQRVVVVVIGNYNNRSNNDDVYVIYILNLNTSFWFGINLCKYYGVWFLKSIELI